MLSAERIRRMEDQAREGILPISPKQLSGPTLARINEFTVYKAHEPGVENFLERKAVLRRSNFLQNPETGFYYRGGEHGEGKKGFKMRKVEAAYSLPGEALGDLLYRLYWKERRSFKEISGNLRTSFGSVFNWLRKAKIESRDPGFSPASRSQNEEKRIEAVRKTYSDPERVVEIAAKIHTPESDAKRSATTSAWHRANPDKSREMIMRAQRGTLEAADRRVTGVLGEAIESILRQGLTEDRLSYREFASKHRLSPAQVRRAERRYLGINRTSRGLNNSRINEAQEVKLFRELLGNDISKLLTPAQFETVSLVYPADGIVQKYEEVAQKRGVTRQAVQITLAAALKRLREKSEKID